MNCRTMADVYSGSLARTSFVLVLLAIAGGMALLLGVIGIFGVIAYIVVNARVFMRMRGRGALTSCRIVDEVG